MSVENLLEKLKAEHEKALRQLDRHHRYTAGTRTSETAWTAYCNAREAFDKALDELRVASGVMGLPGQQEKRDV